MQRWLCAESWTLCTARIGWAYTRNLAIFTEIRKQNGPSTVEFIFIVLNFVACIPVLLSVGGFRSVIVFKLVQSPSDIELASITSTHCCGIPRRLKDGKRTRQQHWSERGKSARYAQDPRVRPQLMRFAGQISLCEHPQPPAHLDTETLGRILVEGGT